MMSRYFAVVCLGLAVPALWATDEPKQDQKQTNQAAKKSQPANTPVEQIAAIKKQHEDRWKKFQDDLRAANSDRKKVSDLNQEFFAFEQKQAEQLKALIKEHGKEADVFEAFLVLVDQLRYWLDEEMIQVLLKHHLANPKMGELCFDLRYRQEPTTEKLLREVAAKHPQQALRGQAVYALGDYYRNLAMAKREKPSEQEEVKRLAEAASYYTAVTKDYAAVTTPDGRAKLGDKAASELIRINNLPNLKIGKTAPEISGEDIDRKRFKLSDYRGKVVVLDFWGYW